MCYVVLGESLWNLYRKRPESRQSQMQTQIAEANQTSTTQWRGLVIQQLAQAAGRSGPQLVKALYSVENYTKAIGSLHRHMHIAGGNYSGSNYSVQKCIVQAIHIPKSQGHSQSTSRGNTKEDPRVANLICSHGRGGTQNGGWHLADRQMPYYSQKMPRYSTLWRPESRKVNFFWSPYKRSFSTPVWSKCQQKEIMMYVCSETWISVSIHVEVYKLLVFSLIQVLKASHLHKAQNEAIKGWG